MSTGSISGLFPLPAFVIAATAFAVVAPMLFLGNPSGHDFEFHLNSWMEVPSQWHQGIVYPRWAEFAHYGYGEARFLFYPPASWVLGALLGVILPWKVVPGVYAWIALTAAGVSMFVLARRWLAPRDAIFAAAFYAGNPYHLVLVYWRSADAELLASALFPLLLLFVLEPDEEGQPTILPLTLLICAAWLTNLPAAVMMHYSLALLLAIVAVVRRSPWVLLRGATAIVLGAALASFFLVPAVYEEKWVKIAEVLSPGVRPRDNFLLTTIADPDHNRFNLLVTTVAMSEITLATAAAFLARRRKRTAPVLWWAIIGWTLAAVVIMFSFTSVLWLYLPKLRFVQLPWRWLLCFNVGFALLVALGTRRWITRAAGCLGLLFVLFMVWWKVQPPWWDNASDIAEMESFLDGGQGYEGTDEYVPAGADPYEIKRDAARIAVASGSNAKVNLQEWSPESKRFTVEAAEPETLSLRLFNYPAWVVEVNDQIVQAGADETTGQMIIPLTAGSNRVRISFARTEDRKVGMAMSVIALPLVGGLAIWEKRKRRRTA